MSSRSGWVKAHRSFLDWEWFRKGHCFKVMMALVFKANYKDRTHRGTPIPRGSLIIGRELFASELGISISQLRTSLSHLESTGEVTIKSSRKGTLVQVVKYEDYQSLTNESTNELTSNLTSNLASNLTSNLATLGRSKKEEDKNTMSDEAPPAEDGVDDLFGEEVETKIDTEKDFLRDLWESAPAIARSRSSKKDVLDAWSKIAKKNRPSHKIVLESYQGWLLCVEWTRDGGQAIPGLHRWIKKEQWESTPEPAPSHNQNSPSLPSSPTYTRACG